MIGGSIPNAGASLPSSTVVVGIMPRRESFSLPAPINLTAPVNLAAPVNKSPQMSPRSPGFLSLPNSRKDGGGKLSLEINDDFKLKSPIISPAIPPVLRSPSGVSRPQRSFSVSNPPFSPSMNTLHESHLENYVDSSRDSEKLKSNKKEYENDSSSIIKKKSEYLESIELDKSTELAKKARSLNFEQEAVQLLKDKLQEERDELLYLFN